MRVPRSGILGDADGQVGLVQGKAGRGISFGSSRIGRWRRAGLVVDLGREAVGGLLERSLFFLARRHCNVLHGRKIRWDVDERSIHGCGGLCA